jgi:nucleoside-diphosphate-sugar epimerase
MARRTALIAGASGLIGRRIAQQLKMSANWEVIGLARAARPTGGMRWIAVDLTDAHDCSRKLAQLASVTHLFYAARFDHPEGAPEAVEANAAMLSNVVDVLEASAALEHVHVVHGSKYYGHQLGPIKVPADEDDRRAPDRNFYFMQEDFLRARSGRRWSYTTTRPHAFCDPAVDIPRSIGLLIAVYAAVQRELDLPLYFPGSVKAFEVRTQFTDIAMLARAIEWMGTEPRCANQAFNIVNGDYPSWAELWPRFARSFGIEPGTARAIKLAEYMAGKDEVWQRIIAKYGLLPTTLDKVVLWSYGDYVFKPEWDIMSSMAKARAFGFEEAVDTYAMFMRQFDRYRAQKVIPRGEAHESA